MDDLSTKGSNSLLRFVLAVLLAGVTSHAMAQGKMVAFASYESKMFANEAAEAIAAEFNVDVHKTPTEVRGKTMVRLHSSRLPSDQATWLHDKARNRGYNAWMLRSTGAERTKPMVVCEPTVAGTLKRDPRHTPEYAAKAYAKLKLPEGPLLGDLFPPRQSGNR